MAGERERLVYHIRGSCEHTKVGDSPICDNCHQAANLLEADAAELDRMKDELWRKDDALSGIVILAEATNDLDILNIANAALATPRNEARDKGEG